MTHHTTKSVLILAILLICFGCLDPYAPPASSGNLNALVVDGYIDSDGTAHVKLLRSLPLADKGNQPKETGATLTIESSEGDVFSLHEDSTGLYVAKNLSVDYTSKYQLHIITSNSSEYKSDEVQIYSTPAIDSVYWTINAADRLEIRSDTHESGSNTTGYYLINGIETYEYHAAVHSGFKFINKIAVPRFENEEIYTCWRNMITPNVLRTTKGLADKVISGSRLSIIERTSPKISVRYSILAQQRAISEDEYNYQRQLLASTEQQGSLFAPTPGAVFSNVRGVTNASEYVLGYFRGQELKTLRYFIGSRNDGDHEIPKDFKQPGPDPGCQTEITCPFDQLTGPPSLCVPPTALGDDTIIADVLLTPQRMPIAYVFVRRDCGDCTVFGGVTTKPPFW